MAVDEEFIKNLEKQTKLLRNLQEAVSGAIERADKNIKRMQNGESKEQVFGPVPPKK